MRGKKITRNHGGISSLRRRRPFGLIEQLEGRRLLSGTPEVTLTGANDSFVSEGHTSTCRFLFARSGPTDQPLTVRYVTGGTGTNGLDYQRLNIPGALPGTFVIPAGATIAALTLEASFDDVIEGDETILINVAADAAYTVGAASAVMATIFDSPLATPQSVITPEDASAMVTLSGTPSYNVNVKFEVTSLPTHGTLYNGATPITAATPGAAYVLPANAIRYEPAANYFGPDTFNFRLRDGGIPGATATVSITLTPVNEVPVAAADDYTTAEDTALHVAAPGVLANDTDDDGGSLTAVLGAAPTHGTLAFNSNGSFTYTPADDFSGADSFTYRTTDGQDTSDAVTVTLSVTAAHSGVNGGAADPCGEGTATIVIGTSGDDVILVNPVGNPGHYEITVNGQTFGPFADDRIVIRAEEGNDDVQVAGRITVPAWLFGESGNDRLNAGGSGSVVIGGSGNDELLGGGGRDLLIGGRGSDRIIGNAGDDILIAAFTDFDRNYDALCAIMDEWTRSDAGFVARVGHLSEPASGGGLNGGVFLNNDTVHDDGVSDQIDVLTGSAGDDWYLYTRSTGDRATGITAIEAGEVINNI